MNRPSHRAAARPAFARASENLEVARKRDLAAIHAAAADLGLDTADRNPASDYRAMLVARCGMPSGALLDADGVPSAARLSLEGRKKVLAYLRHVTGPAVRPKDGWHAEKMRKLWVRLGELHALHDPSEGGLNKFIASQTGVSAPRFLQAAEGNRIVEALKAWVARAEAKEKAGAV